MVPLSHHFSRWGFWFCSDEEKNRSWFVTKGDWAMSTPPPMLPRARIVCRLYPELQLQKRLEENGSFRVSNNSRRNKIQQLRFPGHFDLFQNLHAPLQRRQQLVVPSHPHWLCHSCVAYTASHSFWGAQNLSMRSPLNLFNFSIGNAHYEPPDSCWLLLFQGDNKCTWF